MRKLQDPRVDIDSAKVKKYKSRIYNMDFASLVKIIDAVYITSDIRYLRFIYDPYAFALLLDPVKNPSYVIPKKDWQPDIYTCEQVFRALLRKEKPKMIMQNFTELEKQFFRDIYTGTFSLRYPPELIFRTLSKYRNFNFAEAWHSWSLQPNPYAAAHTLISPLTDRRDGALGFVPKKPVPVAGYPIRTNRLTEDKSVIRYPCLIQPFIQGERVMAHKGMGAVRLMTEDNYVFESGSPITKLKKYNHTGVIDGVLRDGDFFAVDLLQINDHWLYDRPLSDRMKFFWKFGEFFPRSYIIRSLKEMRDKSEEIMEDLGRRLVIKPLNAKYLPDTMNMARINGNTVFLKAYRLGKNLAVRTSEWDHLGTFPEEIFEHPMEVINDVNGRILEVDRNGRALRVAYEYERANTTAEVMHAFGMTRKEDVRFKSMSWDIKDIWIGDSRIM